MLTMKKLKDNIPFIINIIIIIVPFLLVNNWVFKSLELNIHEGLKFSLSGIITFGFFAISLGIHTIIHEFGHLVTGLISGYKYVFFRIWKFALVKESGKIKIKNFHIPGTLGQCLMAPPSIKENGTFPFLFYNLGGIIFNFLFSIIGLIVIAFSPLGLFISFLLSFSLVGIYLGGTNSYPFGFVPNDGTNIQSLLRSDDSKKAFYNALLLNEKTVRDKVSKKELKKYVSKDLYKDFNEPVVQGVVSEYVSVLIEENKLLEALKLANFLLNQKNMSIILRNLLRLDKMTIFLLLGDKKGIENLLKNNSFKKALNSKGDSSIERLKYMYYSLYEKDENKSKLALNNFNKLSESTLINSSTEYDKKLIDFTDEKLYWENHMEKLDSTSSTNDYLKEKIETGSETESVIAKSQSNGKGQRSKSFYSPEGGMYISVKIVPEKDSDIKYITSRTAILVVESIKKALNKNVQIKWINDLIYKGKKVGGILTESKFSSNGELEYIVLGIGLNLIADKNIPKELENIYQSLEVKNLEYVKSAILYYLMPSLKTLEKDIHINEFLNKYNKYLFEKDKEIYIENNSEIIKGKLLGIDDNINILMDIDKEKTKFSYNNTRILYNYEEERKKSMIKGILLDMDGLVSDTERLHMKAYQSAFNEKGIELTDEKYSNHWIQRGLGVADFVKELNLESPLENMQSIKCKYYEELLNTDLNPMPFAIEFVNHFKGKIPMVVASASLGKDVRFALEKFGILEDLEFVLAYEDVSKRKPDPEIWIKGAEKLGLNVEECIALEDSEKGVIAAHRANMRVIAIPNEHTFNHDFSKATWVVKNLEEAKDLIEKINKGDNYEQQTN